MLELMTDSKLNALFSAPKTPDVKRCRAWLDNRIERGKKGQFSEIATISPALAEIMLERNTHNRRISPQKVAEWIATLKDGRWLLTSQGVAFAEPGFLSDGQHRLTAIVRSGAPAKMQVTFGEDPEAHKVLDTGKKRTPADAAHIVGIADAVRKTAVAKIILEVEAGRGHNPAPVANDIIVQAIHERPRLSEAIHAGARMYRTTRAAPAGLGAGLYFIDQVHQPEDYEPFVEGVATGLGFEHRHDPRLTLRNTLIGKKFTTKNRSYVVAAYVVKAWNRWKSGKALQALGWRSDEDFPLVR